MSTNSRALAKLEHWARMLRTTPALTTGVSKEIGHATLELIQEGFERESDPYGKRWAPKKRPDGRRVLVGKTRRLSTGWGLVRMARGFQVRPSVDYAAAHQAPGHTSWGGYVRPRRMMVPVRSRGLPRTWRDRFKSASRRAFRAHFLR